MCITFSAILDNAYNVPDYHNTQHAGEKQGKFANQYHCTAAICAKLQYLWFDFSDFTQSDSSVQETYAAIDPTALASKKQKKAKVKTANRKNRQAQQKTTTCHAENQNSMPDQEEAYQVRNTFKQIQNFKQYETVHSKHLQYLHPRFFSVIDRIFLAVTEFFFRPV